MLARGLRRAAQSGPQRDRRRGVSGVKLMGEEIDFHLGRRLRLRRRLLGLTQQELADA